MTSMSRIRPVEAAADPATTDDQLLAERAYNELRQQILDSRLRPGAQLSIPALARAMDISRSPTREAVQRLIHEGLAKYVPRRGAEVTRLDLAELLDIYAVKEPLSGMAARLAATRLTETGVAKLRSMLEEQEAAFEENATATVFMSLDLAFHSYIDHVSGNKVLAATMSQFSTKTNLAFPSAWESREYMRLSIDEHHEIANALISGDEEAADRVTRAHVRKVRTRLKRWSDARHRESASDR